MINLTPLTMVPPDIQQDWMAGMQKGSPAPAGIFQVTDISRTPAQGFMAQRISVLVVDEEGRGLPGVRVAFAFDTAGAIKWDELYPDTKQWGWAPPPMQAAVIETMGGGMCDFVQGSPVKEGQPGGMTVYVLEPEYSSDIITGCGMLADHTGMFITFKLTRTGYVSTQVRLNNLEERVAALEER